MGRFRDRRTVDDSCASSLHPDSDKIAMWPGDKRDDLLLSRAARMGYWDGE